MPDKKLICLICGDKVPYKKPHVEPFLDDRIFVLKHPNPVHECGHQSLFEYGEPIYASFLSREDDKEALLLSKHAFSKWKGKFIIHPAQEGVEDEDYFKITLDRALNEIREINRSAVKNKEEKIKLLMTDKFQGSKEKIKLD